MTVLVVAKAWTYACLVYVSIHHSGGECGGMGIPRKVYHGELEDGQPRSSIGFNE
jgi:hypothetical protein